MNVEDIAVLCHDANRLLCARLGDHSITDWTAAAERQRHAMAGVVRYMIANPARTIAELHNEMVERLIGEGWTNGPARDDEAKVFPHLVAFSNLPLEQRAKLHLLEAVVTALAPLLNKQRDAEPARA